MMMIWRDENSYNSDVEMYGQMGMAKIVLWHHVMYTINLMLCASILINR